MTADEGKQTCTSEMFLHVGMMGSCRGDAAAAANVFLFGTVPYLGG